MEKVIKIEELVKELKEGNKEVYAELINPIYKELYGIAMSRLKNEADAQDAVQNTIIIGYTKIGELKDNKNFKTWIIKILINECNKIYNNEKKHKNIIEKYSNTNECTKELEDDIDFENLIKSLNEQEKEIFKLYYEEGYKIKEIANKLNINENTVKTNLSRGKVKIKKHYKPASIFMFILCIILATSVLAISVIGYIKDLFETSSVGKVNDGVLMAVENMDWYQEVDMDYIDLGDGYKLKIEYILLDEMNLYMVYDIESEKDISKFTDVYLPDLKITNENGEVICNQKDIFEGQYQQYIGDKFIENDKNHIKSLLYMYTDRFPISNTLNISFSKISLAKQLKEKNEINCDVNLEINLEDKFINRKFVTYNSDSDIIEKAIITETGFYAIIDTKKLNTPDIYLIDENNAKCKCFSNILTTDNGINRFIIISDVKDSSNNNIKLVINDDNEIILNKEE